MSKRVLSCCTGALALVLAIFAWTLTADRAQQASAAQDAKEPKGQPSVPPEGGAAPSRITAVTVYPSSALVTREVDVPAGKGTVELTVTPLPPTIVVSSLYSEGMEGVRVLTTRYRTRTIVQDTRVEARKLQDELTTLTVAREKIEADVKAIQENLKMLGKMEGYLTITTIQATEKAALNADAVIALAKHIKDSRLETTRELTTLQQQVKVNQDKAAVAQQRLTELGGGGGHIERDAVVVVERVSGAAGKVRLNYLVDAASWRPQYKLRATTTGKDPVQLEYLAALVQNSGEDWNNVKLMLSTAQPMLNAAPPDLQALKVAAVHKTSVATRPADPAEIEEQIRNLRTKAQKDFNERKAKTGIGLINTASALDQSFELLNPDAAIRRGCALAMSEGPTVIYNITTVLAVPSRKEEQVLEVARAELVPEFYHKALPLLTTFVYRQADLINKSNHVILPGDATMYIGNDFVGQMNLPQVAIGEKFTVGFGIDPQMQVKRQMVDRGSTTQGGNQTLRFGFRTLVSNFKNEKVKLQVWDRLPQAETDAVIISIIKTQPELSKDPGYLSSSRGKNLLRWDVTVEPNAINEKALPIEYEFKMELDRQLTITNFQSAGVFGQPGQGNQAALAPVSADEQILINTHMAKLSAADQQLARTQVFCAIDQDSRLGSMGPIQKVMLKGRPVFLCCKGCEAEANAHPDETLLKVSNLISRIGAK